MRVRTGSLPGRHTIWPVIRPQPTARLTFRNMTSDDLDVMAQLLGDPDVMRYYPHPKSRDEARHWIDWTLRNYAEHGFGLWVLQSKDTGAFIGDCGLTWQRVDGERLLEVGYHVLPVHQGKGYATEAARACLDQGFDVIGEDRVTAVINPANAPSRRVAEHLGMTVEKQTTDAEGRPVVVYSANRR